MIPMHLNDNEMDLIQDFLPKYKIVQEFSKNVIFVSSLFINSKVLEQTLMKMNKS